MEDGISAGERLADVVRKKSKAGCLVEADELLRGLKQENPASAKEGEDTALSKAVLGSMIMQSEDLKEICTKGGNSFYYSSLFISDPYARILVHKQEGATELIAETVREDSERYPRPTPLDVFKEAPFELSEGDRVSCLEEMSKREEFHDIGQVTTSTGRVFLYSSKHLDRDYALMLAEWVDVGQFENP